MGGSALKKTLHPFMACELGEHFNFFDAGVFRALRPQLILDSASEMDGEALEGLVAQHLRAWIDYTKTPHQLAFWRTKAGLEVDFVIYGPMGLWGIEVKNSEHIHPQDLRSLLHFKEDYPEAHLCSCIVEKNVSL